MIIIYIKDWALCIAVSAIPFDSANKKQNNCVKNSWGACANNISNDLPMALGEIYTKRMADERIRYGAEPVFASSNYERTRFVATHLFKKDIGMHREAMHSHWAD